MSDTPSDLKYAKSHEWLKKNDDGTVSVGITAHAQKLLGDLVYVELPELNSVFKQEDESATVESVKSASEVYAPISGEVVAVNNDLEGTPNLVNEQPYDAGWLYQLKPIDEQEIDQLLTADQYAELVEAD